MINKERCLNCDQPIEKDYILFANGVELFFDSFECAVNFVVPRCNSCNSIIIGHKKESYGNYYCDTFCLNNKNASSYSNYSNTLQMDLS